MSSVSLLKFANFAKTLITNSSFTGATTSFTVTGGTGSRFPTVPFRATLWNNTDYDDPSNARYNSQGELVEVTARSTDTLTVVRAKEGTSAISSTSGKVYAIEVAHTAEHLSSCVAGVFNPLSNLYGGTGDGVANDTAAILAATAACKAAGGGIIWIPDGTFLLDKAQWLIDFSNCWVLGSAKAIIKLRGTPTVSDVLLSIIGTVGAEITNIRVEGVEFDGSATGTVASFVQLGCIDIYNVKQFFIEKCYFHHILGDGILVDNGGGSTSEFWIEKNTFRTVYRNGISMVGGNQIFHIIGNQVHGFATFGIDLECNNVDEIIKSCEVRGNYCIPNATRINTANSDRSAGISLIYPDRTGNITGTTGSGVSPIVVTIAESHLAYVTGEQAVVSGVGGNTAANGYWNITVLSPTTFSLDGSTGTGTYTSGGIADVLPRGDANSMVRITDNQVDGFFAADLGGGPNQAPRAGIRVFRYHGVAINGNQIYACGGGISVGSEGPAHQHGNVGSITGNQIRLCNSIGISAYSNWAITGNVVELCGFGGMYIVGPKNTITGNLCRNNGTDVTQVERSGIIITGDDNVVVANICYDDQESSIGVPARTQLYGVYIPNGTVGCIVTDNHVSGNATAGVRVPSPVSTNKIHGNIGFATEAANTDSIPSGSTNKTIAHGLGWTPRLCDFSITWGENPTNDPTAWWINGITSTEFSINLSGDPGGSGLDFGWSIVARP